MVVNSNAPLTALQVMQDAPVIPVIVLTDVAHAVPMARALVAGGIRMLEVTLRTPQALACMQAIAQEVPGAVVGAGTVRSPADAAAAAQAGPRCAGIPCDTLEVCQAFRGPRVSACPGGARRARAGRLAIGRVGGTGTATQATGENGEDLEVWAMDVGVALAEGVR